MTAGPSLESTARLLVRAREGDRAAQSDLVQRYAVLLRQWAHGRLPASARDLVDTSDLVQVTLARAFGHLDTFEPRREGAFLAYVRQILLNQIRDEARRAKRRPAHDELPEEIGDTTTPSPLEEVIGKENIRRYEEALARLPERQREAIILRVELGFRYREVAEAVGAQSVNAARLMVARALVRLASIVRGAEEGAEEQIP